MGLKSAIEKNIGVGFATVDFEQDLAGELADALRFIQAGHPL
jgi:hypothetical protein